MHDPEGVLHPYGFDLFWTLDAPVVPCRRTAVCPPSQPISVGVRNLSQESLPSPESGVHPWEPLRPWEPADPPEEDRAPKAQTAAPKGKNVPIMYNI